MLWVLDEAILMSTHNICFYGEMRKIIPKLSPNTQLICSTGFKRSDLGIRCLSNISDHDFVVEKKIIP